MDKREAKSTGFREGLYSLEGYEPDLAQQVEEGFFKKIDQRASIALTMLERSGHQAPWESDSRTAWTTFLLSLLLSCPEDIKVLRKYWREEVFGTPSQLDEAEYARVRSPQDPERFSDYLKNLPGPMKERAQYNA